MSGEPNNKTVRPTHVWESRIWSLVILAAAALSGGISLDNNSHVANLQVQADELQSQIVAIAILEQRLLSHIGPSHPDIELTRRADRQQEQINRLSNRILELERELRQKSE